MNKFPIEIQNLIIDYKMAFNERLKIENEIAICKFTSSFDDLIIDHMNSLHDNASTKYYRNMKIITKTSQPEEAHYIPACDNMLYWKLAINKYKNDDYDFNFKIKRDVNDCISQHFYKKELQLYYFQLAKKNKYIPIYECNYNYNNLY